MEIEIGRNKRGRRVYAFDDIAVVPSRRTRDPHDVSINWTIDAYHFDIPVLAAPMDSVVSPATAIRMGQLGGLGVLDLEGVWTRYENPEPLLEEIRSLAPDTATARMREIYAEPIKPELVTARLAEIRAMRRHRGRGPVAAAHPGALRDGRGGLAVDLFVIRGTTVSAEHVSKNTEPLNLKKFIYELDVPVIVGGAATYTAALHLMRTGAACCSGGVRRRSRIDHPRDPGHPCADGHGRRRCRRRSPRLYGRVGRTLRARDRRRWPRNLG